MTALAIEIVNVDEDVAEKTVRLAIEAISPLTKVKSKTLTVEPHDETRGVWAKVDIDLPSDANAAYKTSLVSTIKGFVNAQLYTNAKANVYVSITN